MTNKVDIQGDLDPGELIREVAASDDDLKRLLPEDPATSTERSWRRLEVAGHELWLIGWPAGTQTGWHDHGAATEGAFMTVSGRLAEYSWDGTVHARTLTAGAGRLFEGKHIHNVVNDSGAPAVSLHAYTPRLNTMTRYEYVGGRLRLLGVEAAGADRADGSPAPRRGIDSVLADARGRLTRIHVEQAYREVLWEGAHLVDIRPAAQRAAEGEVHAALRPLVIERNVLEWRWDPLSDARLPQAAYDARVLVLCQEGYTSSLAADALRQLGLHRSTDVIGGFAAWSAAGLPVCTREAEWTAPDAA